MEFLKTKLGLSFHFAGMYLRGIFHSLSSPGTAVEIRSGW